MSWPGAREHDQLHRAATSLVAILRDIRNRLVRHEVHCVVHDDLADRCRSLGVLLDSAVADAERDAYGPALALMRSAMEHVYVDQLAFLGRRHVQIFKDVDEATWAKMQQDRAGGTAWKGVTEWSRRKKGRVRIVREGLHSKPDEDGNQQSLGIHYFLLNDFSPFVGPPKVQEHFDDGLSDVEERRKLAKHHQFLYEEYLRWASLKESLKANGFADEAALHKLDVHYRFLSAFTHPYTDVAPLLYGRNQQSWPVYDHYSSELVLLYAVVFSVIELRNFYAMTLLPHTVGIEGWEDIERQSDSAWRMCSYLWFPGHEPHPYDRFQEANRRGFRQLRASGGGANLVQPSELDASEIGYYGTPLQRLVQMHSHSHELMTGFVYQSPWHRDDVRCR